MTQLTKFHWTLPIEAKKTSEAQADQSGRVDLNRLKIFLRIADRMPIDSLLTPFGFHMPDPIPLLGLFSQITRQIKFLLAYRPGLMSPTLFVQQINTLSQLMPDRLALNLVAGFSPEEQAFYGDHLAHDDRFHRADEFIQILQAFWHQPKPVDFQGKHFDIRGGNLKTKFVGKASSRPRIYLSGNSKIAKSVASQQADCLLRYGDTPQKIEKFISELNSERSLKVGLRMSIISGKTRGIALEKAARVVANPDQNWKTFLKKFVERCDSVAIKSTFDLTTEASSEWLTPHLWTGAVPFRGGPALALVGSYDEIASELFRYTEAGVSEFILSGWPTELELLEFSKEILPKFRTHESFVAGRKRRMR